MRLAEEELRPYFPLPRVLDGLFAVVNRLFDLTISPARGPSVWHSSVRYYEMRRRDGTLVGSFYTDLYARPNKRGGAWVDSCVARANLAGRLETPVSYLVCNFNSPVGDVPSLLTHNEAVTLFHEFGHTLHHLLTEVDYPSLSGINGVAWDAVELPSQFLENFVWRPEVLASCRRALRDRRAAAGGQARDDAALAHVPRGLGTRAAARVRSVRLPAASRVFAGARRACPRDTRGRSPRGRRRAGAGLQSFPEHFAHVFGGGYAAGYYSYKWAEVLAADAFGAFEESGLFDRGTAERFRRSILAVGGSRDALDAFVEFRGRPPELDALLRQSGIATPASPQ